MIPDFEIIRLLLITTMMKLIFCILIVLTIQITSCSICLELMTFYKRLLPHMYVIGELSANVMVKNNQLNVFINLVKPIVMMN